MAQTSRGRETILSHRSGADDPLIKDVANTHLAGISIYAKKAAGRRRI